MMTISLPAAFKSHKEIECEAQTDSVGNTYTEQCDRIVEPLRFPHAWFPRIGKVLHCSVSSPVFSTDTMLEYNFIPELLLAGRSRR